MKAIELIDNLFTMNDELTKDAAAHIAHGANRKMEELNHDEFLHNLATWAANKNDENVKDVLPSIKKKYDAAQIATLKDILSVAIGQDSQEWEAPDFHIGTPGQYEEWNTNTMRIIVHRGTKQIGGSITEIAVKNTHILVDCGAELPGSTNTVSDSDIVKLLQTKHFDGVFFTHYHGDHTGLMDKIPREIPIYMDETMLIILRILHAYTGNKSMQELLDNHEGRIHTFKPRRGNVLTVGDMNIIPFFVDHSAYHANMFLFESKATGHTVLHSGDFRSTGYMSKSLDMIPRLIHEYYHKQVDVLLTEGTMMTRSTKDEHLLTEWDVKKEATAFLRDHRQIFVVCSSTNFDSLTSVCNAARANNIPIYGSPYIMEMLKTFSGLAGKYTRLYRLPPVKGIDEMKRVHPKEGVVLLGSLLNREKEDAYSLYDRYGHYMSDYKPYLIYSMWQGYLNPKHLAYDEGFSTFVKRFGSSVKYIHSSGHADRDTLAKFIKAIAPRKYIVPFHTENPIGFKNLNIKDQYKEMVILPQDGDTIEIV